MRLAPFRGSQRRPGRLSPPRRRALCSAVGVLLASGWGPAPVWAQGIPVIDPANLIQATLQAQRALEQIEQMSEQYAKQIEQLSVAIQQRDALLGARGMGQLLNGPEERTARRTLPATFEELLQALASGTGPRTLDELRALYVARSRELDLAEPKAVNPERPDGRAARVYARERSETLAKLAVSEKAYADAAKRVDAYERLLGAIDAAPDLKASTDLANRVAIENGFTMNELLRLQAISLASAAASRAHDLADTTNVAEIAVYESVPLEELSNLAASPSRNVLQENDR